MRGDVLIKSSFRFFDNTTSRSDLMHIDDTPDDWVKDSGLTVPERLAVYSSLEISRENAEEFLRFTRAIADIKPRRLHANDIEALRGRAFRGTSLFLMLLSLYGFGEVFSIKDYRQHASVTPITRRKALVAFEKSRALPFANKYVDRNGSIEVYRPYEQPIFEQFLRDNHLPATAFPAALLQPILLAFDGAPTQLPQYKSFEGELGCAKPNASFLSALETLLGLPDIASRFPIFTSLCRVNSEALTSAPPASSPTPFPC